VKWECALEPTRVMFVEENGGGQGVRLRKECSAQIIRPNELNG